MHNFAKNPGTEKGRDTQFPWPSVCHRGTHTAKLTWGQMGLLRFLTAVGDVGIQGRRDKILLALLEEVCQDIYQQTNTDKTSES